MASAGVLWAPVALRFIRVAATNATAAVRARLTTLGKYQVQYIPIRNGRQPVHPAAWLKQTRNGGRWFSSSSAHGAGRAIRRLFSSEAAPRKFDRASLPSSRTSRRVGQFSGRAPFAHTLRPNLTGGAMPRSAGGYSLGGGARYFSHTPAAPAQVVQNVSQAMRAFFLSGQKLQYDGVGPRGKAKCRSVSDLEHRAIRKLASVRPAAPGAFIDFQLSPTITAISPLAAALASVSDEGAFSKPAAELSTLNTDGLLDVLSADFGRALKDLTAIYADLGRLSSLGDLPITLEAGNVLRVRFPGLDGTTLENICDDIGVSRGRLGVDPGYDHAIGVPMALQFPFAPDAPKAPTSPGGSEMSLRSYELDEESMLSDDSFVRQAFDEHLTENPWMSSPEGYETMSPVSSGEHCSEDFEGLEGIYRFLEECDNAKGRLG